MFELKQQTKAKLQKTDDKALKLGQKEHRPAVIVNLSVTLPNSALEMFDVALRAVLYGKGDPGAKQRKQSQFEGMDMVTDLPSLTKTGQRMSHLNWGEEQTGCTLTVDYGLGDERANIVLRDATTKDFKISLNEGGAIKVGFRVHAPVEHLSAEQLGRLHLMHQRDVKIVLEGPTVDQQQNIEQGGDEAEELQPPPAGNVNTPEKALAKAIGQHAANKSRVKRRA